MTLAAFAGDDEIWNKFETDWEEILHSHSPRADYVHMKEINTQTKGFDWKLGWNMPKAFDLATKCLAYMSHLDKRKFRMFYCSVDLEAWDKVKNDGVAVPDAVEICCQFAMYGVLSWYAKQKAAPGADGIFHLPIDSAHYFFDKDEPFEPKFKEMWNSELIRYEKTGQFTAWVLIKHVSSVDMKRVPGVQAADMLAWSVNRANTEQKIRPGQMYLEVMHQVIPASSVIFNEERLRKVYGPVDTKG
jgi:hypothetical protein